MVLRGAQFQRFGPAGCMFLTRRALSLYQATFVQRRSHADCLQQGRRMAHRRLWTPTVGASVGNLTNQQASRMAVWRWLDPCGTSLCGIPWLRRWESEVWVCP